MAQEKDEEKDEDILEGEEQEKQTEESEGHKSDYPNLSIKVEKAQYSLFELKRKTTMQNSSIIMNPVFQRANVWTTKQKRELMESILMGLPLPLIYLFEDSHGIRQIIDGKQRLSAIFDFMDNKFSLNELEILPDFNKKKFSDLDQIYQAKIENFQILTYVIQPPTPEKVKYNIFDRVNRGGTPLNNHEMRHALYQGNSTELLHRIVNSKDYKDILGREISDKRMKGRYLLLRAFAFFRSYHGDSSIKYMGDIDDFLSLHMREINSLDIKVVESYEKLFMKTFKKIKFIFEDNLSDIFRFQSKESSRKRAINIALFEILFYFFLYHQAEELTYETNILKMIEDVKQKMDCDEYLKPIDSKNAVKKRFELIKEKIKDQQ